MTANSTGELHSEPLELRDGALELDDAVYGALVLCADRGDHPVGADERVDGQEPEVRGRVDHNLVVAVEDGLERVVEEALAAELTDEAHLDAGELAGAGDHVDTVNGGDDRVVRDGAAGEHVDEVDAECTVAEPELSGERALRVGVDDQRALPPVGEEHSDVRCGRGLADAALLVCDRCRGGHDALLRLVGW